MCNNFAGVYPPTNWFAEKDTTDTVSRTAAITAGSFLTAITRIPRWTSTLDGAAHNSGCAVADGTHSSVMACCCITGHILKERIVSVRVVYRAAQLIDATTHKMDSDHIIYMYQSNQTDNFRRRRATM